MGLSDTPNGEKIKEREKKRTKVKSRSSNNNTPHMLDVHVKVVL